VAHEKFLALGAVGLKSLCSNGNGCGVVIDVKEIFGRAEVEALGLSYWSL
jgi:UDP-N-acetyl-D-galactosamine dehydrogenase